MKIACLTSRFTRPSYRFRMGQMLPYFAERRHTVTPFTLPSGGLRRLALFSRLSQHDVVIVQKRALGWLALKALQRSARCIVYDLDDAIFLNTDGRPHNFRKRRFAAMASAADMVVCGNEFLADYSRQYNPNVFIIPTAIDTERFRPAIKTGETPRSGEETVTIGWTGSKSTSVYLQPLLPVLNRLAGPVRLKLISDRISRDIKRFPLKIPQSRITWSPENEVAETAEFDIGIMPLPENNWTRGKCGCKALQYLALGVAAVCSPVGINRDIIAHGNNGFLARTADEWHATLQRLIDNPQRRRQVGSAGRQHAEANYALSYWGPLFVELVETAAQKSRRPQAA